MRSSSDNVETTDVQSLTRGRHFKKLAILRFSSLGDIVLTSPILSSIKTQFPNIELVYVTKSHFAEILRDDPRIDTLIELTPTTSLTDLIRKLRAQRVDGVLDLHGKWRGLALRLSNPFAANALLPKPSRLQQFLVRQALTTFRPRHSIVERYYQAAEQLFREPLAREPLSLHVPPAAVEQLTQSLPLSLEQLQNSVLIAPGAQWETKRWPIKRHIEVSRHLREQGHQVIACGGPSEESLLEMLSDKAGVLSLPHIPLGLLPALLANVRAFIGHDSGPMHIARAVGTPTVAIFGSTPSSQFDFSGHQLVENPQECSPCHFYGRKRCPKGHFACMESIGTEQVVHAFASLPNQRRPLVLY